MGRHCISDTANFEAQFSIFGFEFLVLFHQCDQLIIKRVNFDELSRALAPTIDTLLASTFLYRRLIGRAILLGIWSIDVNSLGAK